MSPAARRLWSMGCGLVCAARRLAIARAVLRNEIDRAGEASASSRLNVQRDMRKASSSWSVVGCRCTSEPDRRAHGCRQKQAAQHNSGNNKVKCPDRAISGFVRPFAVDATAGGVAV